MFSWGSTTEERMISEIEAELEDYKRRCEALHEGFRQRLHTREEARAALEEADEQITSLQMEGVALLSSLNTAMSEADEEKIRELERGYKRNSRDLVKAQRARDERALRLESVELDEEEMARGLKESVTEVLDEYAERVRERKQWLTGIMGTLDEQQKKLSEAASPSIGEYESRRSKEFPAAEDHAE